jgi:hypothetical protein
LSAGLLLAQVPENSPSFFAQILIEIPATPSASSAMLSPIVVHSMLQN